MGEKLAEKEARYAQELLQRHGVSAETLAQAATAP
jgi:hypothetical protein